MTRDHHVRRFLIGQVLPVIGTVQMGHAAQRQGGTAGGIDQ